jgi:hypothetical protein
MARGALAAMLLAVLSAGCVPVQLQGYRPSGRGSLDDDFCVAGIRDRLRLHAPRGVELSLGTVPHGYRPGALLNVDFRVPAGVTLRWDSARVTLASPEWSRPRAWAIDRIVSGRSTYAATAELPGADGRHGRAYRLTFYATDTGTIAEPVIPPVREFTLTLPQMAIDGARFDPRPVRFEAYREWGFYTCAQ